MNFSLPNVGFWKKALSAVSIMVEEGTFNFNTDGISFNALAPHHVTMVDLKVPKEAFESYSCDKEGQIHFSVSNMLRLLRSAGDESIHFTYDKDEGRVLMELKGAFKRTLSLPTLAPPEPREEIKTPKLDPKVIFSVTSKDLKDILDGLSLVSNYVRFLAEPDCIIIETGEQLETASVSIERGSERLLRLDIQEPSKSSFALSYLTEMAKAGLGVAEQVTLSFGTNLPLKLEYLTKEAQLVYYMAPRIES